jgi:hypothetical protein
MSDQQKNESSTATTGAGEAKPGAPAGAPAPASVPAGASADEIAALRDQMLIDRFDAAAARAGIDESYTEVALELFRKTGKEPTKENLAAFCADLKKTRPALFGPQPASTAPASSHAPAAPAPGTTTTPYLQWQALRAAGRRAEAEAFYLRHSNAIARTAPQ